MQSVTEAVMGRRRHPWKLGAGLAMAAAGAAAAGVASLMAQAGVRAKPGAPAIVGPASLLAWSNATARVSLSWPAVAGAERYRLTRRSSITEPEIVIDELPAAAFAFEGAACAAGSSRPACIYDDVTRIPEEPGSLPGDATRHPRPSYPHAVSTGARYTYRAWAVFPGSIVSPPSPPATVQVK